MQVYALRNTVALQAGLRACERLRKSLLSNLPMQSAQWCHRQHTGTISGTRDSPTVAGAAPACLMKRTGFPFNRASFYRCATPVASRHSNQHVYLGQVSIAACKIVSIIFRLGRAAQFTRIRQCLSIRGSMPSLLAAKHPAPPFIGANPCITLSAMR